VCLCDDDAHKFRGGRAFVVQEKRHFFSRTRIAFKTARAVSSPSFMLLSRAAAIAAAEMAKIGISLSIYLSISLSARAQLVVFLSSTK
jgi:RNase P/RNase MRP subunit p30